MERLYINGKQQAEMLDLPSDGIIGFGTRRTPITRIAYGFFYFFPVSFFVSLYLSTRASGVVKTCLLPVAVAAGLAVFSEGFQALLFNRSIDAALLTGGMVIGVLGAVSGQIFAARERIHRNNFGGFRHS